MASSSSPLSRDSGRPFPDDESGSDDDMDWEEVTVPVLDMEPPPELEAQAGPSRPSLQPIEITLDTATKGPQRPKKATGVSHAERVLRLETHKIHTVCLISNGWIRNKYLNDPLLHARLMSLTPPALQNSFTRIHKKHEPDAARRGRLFEAAVMRLTQWWVEEFFDADPRASGEIQNRTFDEVAAMLREGGSLSSEADEVIRSSKSLQKHALLRHGSRDVTAQLFTALCRALGIPARLVVSVQSVPWKASIGKIKLDNTRMGKQQVNGNTSEGEMEEVIIPSDPKGKGKMVFPGEGQTLSGTSPPTTKASKHKHFVKLRKQRPQGRMLRTIKRMPAAPLGGYPPAQWTEVFSRPDCRWISVDPIRNYVGKPKLFEPPAYDKRNRMVYVLAYEEDGWVRDVTQRYAREFTNKTSKIRVGGKGKKEWWEKVMAFLTRPYRLHRDDVEDAELQSRHIIEGMPTSVAGFKDHPLYVLERHLLRDETLQPRTQTGRFRGEPVFSRSSVVSGLKAAENWMRSGRVVASGEQPMKWVKTHAVTIGRRRAVEIAGESQDAAAMQGLYAESQTELYRPPPVVDGKVPKNDFGNLDLYVDTMLPSGGVHIPYKGAAKIARELGFDYAEAVTGFEFKHRRAFPIVTGIVIAAENESVLLEAYWESAQDAEEKERIKREERVLQRWARLVQGLRIRKRLQEQYVDREEQEEAQHPHGLDNREDVPVEDVGGFLVETADTVVQPYTLPKPVHGGSVMDLVGARVRGTGEDADTVDTFDVGSARRAAAVAGVVGGDAEEEKMEMDEEEDVVAVAANSPGSGLVEQHPRQRQGPVNTGGAPKTMQQLAEAMESARELAVVVGGNSEGPATPSENGGAKRNGVRGGRGRGGGSGGGRGRKRKRGRGRIGSEEDEEKDEEDAVEEEERRRGAGSGTVTTTTTTRTLRARKLKSEEQVRQEREMELAFRRAIAE